MSAPNDRALRRARSLASHVTVSSTGRDVSGPGSTDSPESWVRREGDRFGPGKWMVVDQIRVDAFAECTEDHQWIHRAGAATPFGGPIAHGFLTLSLLPALCRDVLPRHPWVASEINCGFNKTRFVSPVAVGARVRAAVELVRAKALEPPARGVETVTKVTVEIEGNARPALVAEWVTRQYAAEAP